MLEIVPCSMQTNSAHIRSLLRFISHKKNIWYEVRDKQKEQGSTAEQTWGLRFLSAPALARAQKSMSAYVLTSRAHGSPARFPSGFPRSPHSPNHSHAHCPLCCCVFTVCLKNSPLSSPPLYIKSELSLAVPSKTSATNTHSEYISPSGSNPQMLSKNKIVDVTDMRSFTKLIPWLISSQPNPRHSPRLLLWWGPSGDKVLQSLLHVLSSQLPSLHVVILDGCATLELSPAASVQKHTSCQA